MLNTRPQGSPTFKSRYLGYPELLPRREMAGNIIGNGGSIVIILGKENTSFATGWPMRRPVAKSEEGWSIGFARCTTSESSAGTVKESLNKGLTHGEIG
jgi:hypothetical protein